MVSHTKGGRPSFTGSVDAARTFLGELRSSDESMIVGIGSEVEILAPLSPDRAEQVRILSTMKPWGTTGLHDAIIESIDAIQAAKGRRALVLLSDGNDRYSKASASAALERARRSDVMIYPVAIGARRPPLFAELATLTGGRSFQPRNMDELQVTMKTIANELRHQYLLGVMGISRNDVELVQADDLSNFSIKPISSVRRSRRFNPSYGCRPAIRSTITPPIAPLWFSASISSRVKRGR
jgi:hypothetical protein